METEPQTDFYSQRLNTLRLKYHSYSQGKYVIVATEQQRGKHSWRDYREIDRVRLSFELGKSRMNRTSIHCHEMIFNEQMAKPYLDVDISLKEYPDFDDEDFELLIECFIKAISAVLQNHNIPFDPTKHLIMLSSNGDKKYSVNFIVTHCMIKNATQRLGFAEEVKANLSNPYYSKFMDMGVYKSSQSIRCCYSSKLEDVDRIKKPIDSWTYEGQTYTLCHYDRFQKTKHIDYLKSQKRYWFDVSYYSQIGSSHKVEHTLSLEKEKKPKAIVDEHEIEKVDFSKIPKEFNVTEIKGNIIQVDRKQREPWHCEVCDRRHDSQMQAYITVDKKNNYRLRCFQDETNKKFVLLK